MMKKILLVLMIALAASVNAQVKFAPGIRGGANFSKISDTDLGFKPDFYVGGFAGIQFNKVYTLQPELVYSRQGAKGDYDFYNNGVYENRNVDISLSYVSLGIVNKFTFVDRLSIMIGPTVDILVDQNVDTDSDADICIMGGLGCRIVDGLGVEIRVKKGFASTVSDTEYTDGDGFFEVDNASNLVLQLGLTYTFGR